MNDINQLAIARSETSVFDLVSTDRETLNLADFTQAELDEDWPENWHSAEKGLLVLRKTVGLISSQISKKPRLEFARRVIDSIIESLNSADTDARFHLAFRN